MAVARRSAAYQLVYVPQSDVVQCDIHTVRGARVCLHALHYPVGLRLCGVTRVARATPRCHAVWGRSHCAVTRCVRLRVLPPCCDVHSCAASAVVACSVA